MKPTEVDLIVEAPWIIPVCPHAQVLQDHALACHQGRIVAIAPRHEIAEQYTASEQHSLPDTIIAPGLVNSHTHAAMTLLRGLADDMPLETWLKDFIWPAEQQLVSSGFVKAGTELAIVEMLRSGTTCFTDMYFFPDETLAAAQRAGIRIAFGLIVVGFPSAWASNSDEYFGKSRDLYLATRDDPLVQGIMAPHAPYSVGDEDLARIAVVSEELDIPVTIHLHETAQEVLEGEKAGERPFARLQRLGLINERLLAVHMTELSHDEVQILAQAGASVAHCPESNLKLASGLCPVAALANAGVNVSLGTDGAASNNDLDMFGEMRTAALLGKALAKDPSALNAAQVLEMATINGARALGLESQIGSLEVGKSADFIAVNCAGAHAQPLYDPLSHLVYALRAADVHNVWIHGEQALAQGQLIRLDEDQVIANAREWQARISDAVR